MINPAALAETRPQRLIDLDLTKSFFPLLKKIMARQAKIGIIGLGYVGLPLAVAKAKEGFEVTGFDVAGDKVDHVNSGKNYIGDVTDSDLAEMVDRKKLSATRDFSRLQKMDVVVICVPTPINHYKQPDLSYVTNASAAIMENAHEGMLVILESTTYPGTTREIVVSMAKEKGLEPGKNFYIAYSPERIDPGNQAFNVENTNKIVGGMTSRCTELASQFFGGLVHKVSSPEAAEMAKLLENTFRHINIALANEMAQICEKMGIDIWEVIDAAKTKPYGFMPFYPGPGVGGHCIPVDPYYLSYKAREYNLQSRMIELAGDINDNMGHYVVNRVMKMLNDKGTPMKGSKILVLGVTYKKDIADLRESPVLPILEQLLESGAQVTVCDPYVDSIKLKETSIETADINDTLIKEADIVLLTTDHTAFDYNNVAQNARLIFDTRNAFSNISGLTETYRRL